MSARKVADQLAEDRLATCERMWDGCGCKIDDFKDVSSPKGPQTTLRHAAREWLHLLVHQDRELCRTGAIPALLETRAGQRICLPLH